MPLERLLVCAAIVTGFGQAAQGFESPEALIAAAESGLVAARDPAKSKLFGARLGPAQPAARIEGRTPRRPTP